MLQEELIRRSERERKALLDKVATLERSVQGAESERRGTQVTPAKGADSSENVITCYNIQFCVSAIVVSA